MVFNAAYFFAFVGLMIALIAVHERLAAGMGRLGLVAFLAAVLGVMTQGGNMWFDGFAAPWLAEVLPQAFTAPKTAILQTGALLSYVLFALGWVLYGLASLRARAVPVAVGARAGGRRPARLQLGPAALRHADRARRRRAGRLARPPGPRGPAPPRS